MNKNTLNKLSKKDLVQLAIALGAKKYNVPTEKQSPNAPTVMRAVTTPKAVGRPRGANFQGNTTARELAEALVAIHSDSRSDEAKQGRIFIHSLTGKHSKMRQSRATKIIASFGGGEIHGAGLRQSIITIAKRLREGQTVEQILNV